MQNVFQLTGPSQSADDVNKSKGFIDLNNNSLQNNTINAYVFITQERAF